MFSRNELPIHPAPRLLPWLSAPGVLLSVLVLGLPLPTGVGFLLAACVLAIGVWFALRGAGMLAHARVHALVWTPGQLSLEIRAGQLQPVRVSAASRVYARLVLLRVRPVRWGWPRLLVLTDLPGLANCDAESLRRLRVALRYGLFDDARSA